MRQSQLFQCLLGTQDHAQFGHPALPWAAGKHSARNQPRLGGGRISVDFWATERQQKHGGESPCVPRSPRAHFSRRPRDGAWDWATPSSELRAPSPEPRAPSSELRARPSLCAAASGAGQSLQLKLVTVPSAKCSPALPWRIQEGCV